VPGSAREDLSQWCQPCMFSINDEINTISPTLESIEISDYKSFCKKFKFSYNYFYDSITHLPAFLSGPEFQSDKKRLRLETIQEMSCDEKTKNSPYQFQYFTDIVPSRILSFAYDHWGFYNASGNLDLMPSLTKDGLSYYIPPQPVSRESAFPAMQAGILKAIIYPTGGTTQYTYEPNKFVVNNSEVIVGGLRVKKIIQLDSIGVKEMVTNYDYNDYRNLSSAILYSKPVYIQKVRNDINKNCKSVVGIT